MACAKTLLDEGATVVLGDVDEAALGEAVAHARRLGLDVAAIRALLDEMVSSEGGTDARN